MKQELHCYIKQLFLYCQKKLQHFPRVFRWQNFQRKLYYRLLVFLTRAFCPKRIALCNVRFTKFTIHSLVLNYLWNLLSKLILSDGRFFLFHKVYHSQKFQHTKFVYQPRKTCLAHDTSNIEIDLYKNCYCYRAFLLQSFLHRKSPWPHINDYNTKFLNLYVSLPRTPPHKLPVLEFIGRGNVSDRCGTALYILIHCLAWLHFRGWLLGLSTRPDILLRFGPIASTWPRLCITTRIVWGWVGNGTILDLNCGRNLVKGVLSVVWANPLFFGWVAVRILLNGTQKGSCLCAVAHDLFLFGLFLWYLLFRSTRRVSNFRLWRRSCRFLFAHYSASLSYVTVW